MDNTRTEEQEWIERRVQAVNEKFPVFTALQELGIDMVDEATDQQIQCPFPNHGPDNRPSTRYYASHGRKTGHVWCFKEKIRAETVNLIAITKGIGFMEALSSLERRFGIITPKRPDSPIRAIERGENYTSESWSDVPRFLSVLESKLLRVKPKCSINEFVKFCRLIDAIQWDFDLSGKPSQEMVNALLKLSGLMDDISSREDIIV